MQQADLKSRFSKAISAFAKLVLCLLIADANCPQAWCAANAALKVPAAVSGQGLPFKPQAQASPTDTSSPAPGAPLPVAQIPPTNLPVLRERDEAANGALPSDLPTQPLPTADSLYYSQPEAMPEAPAMKITRPSLQALITIDKGLDPFQLDALSGRQVTLADIVDAALHNNLDIQISSAGMENSHYQLLSSYTKFLPDARMGYLWDHIQGHLRFPFALGGAPGPMPIDAPIIIAQAGVRYNAFQGGKVLFGALQSRNNFRSSRWKYHATTNDVLLEATRRYYNLLLSEALLHIRIRAVKTSEEQLRLDTELEQNGMATHLDVLQARTQLSDDRQNLIVQQINRRNAAIQMSEYLNIDQGVDLQPVDTVVHEVRLIANDIAAGKLIGLAAQNRPELKSYREQWLAAKKGIMIAAAPLYPTVQLTASEVGIGQTLTNKKQTVLTPITLPDGALSEQATTVSKQITGIGVLGINATWNLDAFGLTAAANVAAARVQARQAMLQSNQEANAVISQVRQSYLNQLSALRRTEENLARVNSSVEELRLSQLRLQSGLGKNIDVLRAQQDLTNALVQHTQSTIDFNIAQAQLLHDLGLISRSSLLAATPFQAR